MIRFFFLVMSFCVLHTEVISQIDSLEIAIKGIVHDIDGNAGIAIWNLKTNDTLSVNGSQHFPMQSTYKLHLAIAILHQVDHGKLRLSDEIFVSKDEYFPTWSPLMKKYPEGDVKLTLEEILRFTLKDSDNLACDILFRVIGGPSVVQSLMTKLGINNVSIVHTEKQMHADWNFQFENWTTPLQTATVLKQLYEKKILSESSHQVIWENMVNCTTGPKRIKGLLPPSTVVAHRTGTGGTNEHNVMGAMNDFGIVLLPDNTPVIVVVFISRTSQSFKDMELAIANIALKTYHYYYTSK